MSLIEPRSNQLTGWPVNSVSCCLLLSLLNCAHRFVQLCLTFMWVLGIRHQVHMLLLQVLHLLNTNLTSQFLLGLSWCQGRKMNLHLVFISALKSFFWYYFAGSRFFLKNNFSVQCMWVVSMHMCVLRVHLVSNVILTHSFEARSLRQHGARLPVNKPQ